jgi:hypothetical protein
MAIGDDAQFPTTKDGAKFCLVVIGETIDLGRRADGVGWEERGFPAQRSLPPYLFPNLEFPHNEHNRFCPKHSSDRVVR